MVDLVSFLVAAVDSSRRFFRVSVASSSSSDDDEAVLAFILHSISRSMALAWVRQYSRTLQRIHHLKKLSCATVVFMGRPSASWMTTRVLRPKGSNLTLLYPFSMALYSV